MQIDYVKISCKKNVYICHTNFEKKMERNFHETTSRWKTYGIWLFSEDLEVWDASIPDRRPPETNVVEHTSTEEAGAGGNTNFGKCADLTANGDRRDVAEATSTSMTWSPWASAPQHYMQWEARTLLAPHAPTIT
jgi:hypothetical protein